MAGFPFLDHPPEDDEPDDEPTTRWCGDHRIDHPMEEWCPFCLEDAQREAKALGETPPTVRRRRRAV